MENIENQQGMDLLKTIVEKAWEDPKFKQQLINNPSKTISNITGKDLNTELLNGKQLVIVDQSDESKLYLNIPIKPTLNLELSEQELELVAGGGCSVRQAGLDSAEWVMSNVVDPVKNCYEAWSRIL